MRILMTADPELPVPPPLYGGIERIIDTLVRGLQQRGHTVNLLAHPDSTCPCPTMLAWPGLRSQYFRDTFRNTNSLVAATQDYKPDLVHSFSRLQYLLPLLPMALPKIMSYQRQPTGRTVAWANRFAKRSLTFTGCSEHICQQGRAFGGNWVPIHNFVDLKAYQFQPNVAEDAPLVFLSRIEEIKGAHWAIAAARQAKRRLIIAGNRVHSEAGDRYWHEQIKPYVQLGEVEYIGPINDAQKNELLGQAAAMLVPIQWDEPFGIVFVEALACGTPVIACPRGALPEIVRPGVEGFLIQSIAEAVAAIRQLPKVNRQDCRKRVEAQFSSDVIVSRYEQLYQQRLEKSNIPNKAHYFTSISWLRS